MIWVSKYFRQGQAKGRILSSSSSDSRGGSQFSSLGSHIVRNVVTSHVVAARFLEADKLSRDKGHSYREGAVHSYRDRAL